MPKQKYDKRNTTTAVSREEERHSLAFQLTNLQLQWDGEVLLQQVGACENVLHDFSLLGEKAPKAKDALNSSATKTSTNSACRR